MDDKDHQPEESSNKGGSSVIERAQIAQRNNKTAEALQLYEEEIQHLIEEIKDKSLSNDKKNKLKRQCSQYLSMAEVLKMELKEDTISEEMDEEIEQLLDSLTEADLTDYTLDDIHGCPDAVEKLKEAIIIPMKFPQLFKGKERLWKGIMLYGAPGTGKTLLARALAKEIPECMFIRILAVDFISKYVDSEKLLRCLFARVNSCKNSCVLFIDDYEQLFDKEDEECHNMTNKKVRSILFHLISHCSDNVYLIVGTLAPWRITPPFLKRLDKQIYLPLPDKEGRKQIYRKTLKSIKNCLSDQDFDTLAEKTDGYTGADIGMTVRDAAMAPIRKIQKATHFKKVKGPSAADPNKMVDDLLTPCSPDDPDAIAMSWTDIKEDKLCDPEISMEDLLKALERSRPSISKEDLKQFEDFTKQPPPV